MDPLLEARRAGSAAFALLILAAIVPTISTCSTPPEPEALITGGETISSAELRLRLVELPEGFVPADDAGNGLAVVPADPAIGGRIEVLVSDPDEGQNLVSAVKFHRAFIENQEDGDYQGGQELVTHLGSAFYSRGRFTLDGESIEETVVFSLHPDGDRMMRLRYRYPAGIDSSVRVQQLFDVLACVEGYDQ